MFRYIIFSGIQKRNEENTPQHVIRHVGQTDSFFLKSMEHGTVYQTDSNLNKIYNIVYSTTGFCLVLVHYVGVTWDQIWYTYFVSLRMIWMLSIIPKSLFSIHYKNHWQKSRRVSNYVAYDSAIYSILLTIEVVNYGTRNWTPLLWK